MTFWQKLAILVAFLAAYGLGVWKVCTWHYQAAIAHEESRQITSLKEAEQKTQAFEQNWRKADVKTTPCPIPAAELRLLH